MLHDEVVSFLTWALSEQELSVEVETFAPARITVVRDVSDLKSAFIDCVSDVNCVWLSRHLPRKRRHEQFMLGIGELRGRLLQQTQFSGTAEIMADVSVLRKLASRIKKLTTGGCWVVTEAGTVAYFKSFRLSSGAAAASRASQIELKNRGFTQVILPDPPPDTAD
jgi:hypothetical protein